MYKCLEHTKTKSRYSSYIQDSHVRYVAVYLLRIFQFQYTVYTIKVLHLKQIFLLFYFQKVHVLFIHKLFFYSFAQGKNSIRLQICIPFLEETIHWSMFKSIYNVKVFLSVTLQFSHTYPKPLLHISVLTVPIRFFLQTIFTSYMVHRLDKRVFCADYLLQMLYNCNKSINVERKSTLFAILTRVTS